MIQYQLFSETGIHPEFQLMTNPDTSEPFNDPSKKLFELGIAAHDLIVLKATESHSTQTVTKEEGFQGTKLVQRKGNITTTSTDNIATNKEQQTTQQQEQHNNNTTATITATISATITATQRQLQQQEQDQWSCSKCTLLNPLPLETCTVCGTHRFHTELGVNSDVNSNNNQDGRNNNQPRGRRRGKGRGRGNNNQGTGPTQQTWSCGVCTFFNTSKTTYCVLCNSRKN